jgi:hypothetical protein
MIRFPHTVRLDQSDVEVYERAAEAGEWAIPGTFVFSHTDAAKLTGKPRQAFVHGFLGLQSFGWATLVEVGEIAEAEYQILIDALALHFVARYGAPDVAAALPIARQEIEFAAGLCDHELHTLLAVEREMAEDGIRERFKVIRPAGDGILHNTAWEAAGGPDEGDDGAGEGEADG